MQKALTPMAFSVCVCVYRCVCEREQACIRVHACFMQHERPFHNFSYLGNYAGKYARHDYSREWIGKWDWKMGLQKQ